MTIKPIYKTMAEHQRVYNLIWSQMPEMQKRTSSSWWFFLLFPKGEEGYGRRQLMFSMAGRVGNQIRVNDVWLPGIDLKRPIHNGIDQFPMINVGWYFDGSTVHKLLKQPANTVLDASGSIKAWQQDQDGHTYGGEIHTSTNHPLALESTWCWPGGEARFETWGELFSLHTSPHESLNIDTFLGGVHFIAWRQMQFKGEFDLPTGRETLEGIGYFQRVCLNVPTFPWKWIWSVFPDGSMFSAYIPYIGRQLFRKGYTFFPNEKQEQRTLPVGQAGFWDWYGPSEQILFNKAVVTPLFTGGKHPDFAVEVSNKQGDFLQFQANVQGHTRFYIDRPILGGRKETHWSYNEYMFRMAGLNGRIGDKLINQETMGQGFGNLEYSWGLGL